MNILTERRDVVIGVAVALIVGLLLGFGWGRQLGYAGMASAPVTTSTSTEQTMQGGNLIGSTSKTPVQGTVSEGNALTGDNQVAGMSVDLNSVPLTRAGWVAIRDESGRTLGAALFAPGTHSDVSVPLLRSTQADGSYQAIIYFDDGTKTFSLKTETIVLNADGSVAGATFIAQ